MQIAVIDLGTNTFNLLLAKINADKTFTIITADKHSAKIGEGGINKSIITADAIKRAVTAINNLLKTVDKNGGADKVVAVATSAVRSATNSAEFVAEIKQQTGADVTVITGDEEAAFIFEGIKLACTFNNEIVLTLDIGGGSNEFVIADAHTIYWKHSFALGIARAIAMFNPEDPIKAETLAKVENYFNNELELLWNEVAKYDIKTLIGSSGSFDTFRALLKNGEPGSKPSCEISIAEYNRLHKQLLQSTTAQRLVMPGMEAMRVEMIVLSSVFTDVVIKKLGITHIIQSDYSLKEGVMSLICKNGYLPRL